MLSSSVLVHTLEQHLSTVQLVYVVNGCTVGPCTHFTILQSAQCFCLPPPGTAWGEVAPRCHPDSPLWCNVSGHDPNRVCSVSSDKVRVLWVRTPALSLAAILLTTSC